jgi:hypothetical protein
MSTHIIPQARRGYTATELESRSIGQRIWDPNPAVLPGDRVDLVGSISHLCWLAWDHYIMTPRYTASLLVSMGGAWLPGTIKVLRTAKDGDERRALWHRALRVAPWSKNKDIDTNADMWLFYDNTYLCDVLYLDPPGPVLW